MRNQEELTNKQLLIVSHILTTRTHEEACRKAKISKGTLYALLKGEAFKAELKRQRDEVVCEALDRLKCALSSAVDGLVGLMDSKQPHVRYRACKDIIDFTLRNIEIENIEERLEKIEDVISKR